MNISNIQNCYGCGLCSVICAKHIIEIKLNAEGFYTPVIKELDKCTNCGLCTQVCAFLHDELSSPNNIYDSYAVWSTDNTVRHKCSSGGIAFELGRMLLEKGYKICCVRYNPNTNRAEHYIATTIEELGPSIGSKYIQSYTVDGFKSINKKERYLVIGSPCQIDSFRRYIRKLHCEENFVLMDFFCHGVPSIWLWEKYTKEIEKVTGKITYASWRNKFTGWHDSYAISINGEKSFYKSKLSQGDTFYKLFLSDVCLGKACYERCKYKHHHSSADIRIGDLWGIKFRKNEDGVSGVLTFTKHGDELMHSIKNLHIEPCELKYVIEGQMKNAPELPKVRNQIVDMLKDNQITLKETVQYLQPMLHKKRMKKLLTQPLSILRNRLFKYFNL
ncbi:Coenzyme F420 hydrogenase/dehydrogenase, beta subunit C-terminal domain [Phocaeicola coprocola]|uniref:Coenzyme F420 hydrogenase/dehydrogenase, beta subunit C-terminal domain n=1 Tax=Phocaeicola coprocola TaxID=310298 RepID=UPI003991D211